MLGVDHSCVGSRNPLVHLAGMFRSLVSSRWLISIGAADVENRRDLIWIVADEFVCVLLTAEPQIVNDVVHLDGLSSPCAETGILTKCKGPRVTPSTALFETWDSTVASTLGVLHDIIHSLRKLFSYPEGYGSTLHPRAASADCAGRHYSREPSPSGDECCCPLSRRRSPLPGCCRKRIGRSRARRVYRRRRNGRPP